MSANKIRIANNRLITANRWYWAVGITALLLGVIVRPYLPFWQVITITVSLCSICLLMQVITYLFWRDEAHDQRAIFWENWLAAGNIIAGSTIGVSVAWLYWSLPAEIAYLVLMIASLLISGWSIANIPSMKCNYSFFLPAITPILTAIVWKGMMPGHFIAIIFTIYVFALLKHAVQVSNAYRSSVEVAGRLEAQAGNEKRSMETALKEGERLKTIYEMLPIPVVIVEKGTSRLLYANRTALDLIGIMELPEISDVRGIDFLKRPEEQDNILRNLIKKDGIATTEFLLKRGDGDDFWAFVTMKAIKYEGRPATLVTIADITQRLQTEEALRKSEEKYHLLADNAHDMISYFTLDGICSYVSPSIEKILGYTQDEFTGQLITNYMHHDDFDMVSTANTNSKKTGAAAQYIYRVRHREGHWEWLEATSTPIKDPGSAKYTHIVSVSRLVTGRLRHEQELKEARERAESADRAKSEFLANMSHEIRTPLNAIIGFSEVMRDELFGPLGSPRYQEYMKDIHDSGLHLLALINDVLDLSKVEAGKFELHEDRESIGSLTETVLRLLREKAESKLISLQSRIGVDPYIWCDRRVMTQVLLNIVGNAIKFTPERGRITVGTRLDQEGNLLLSVTDTGIGISAEDLERVMLPFQQSRKQSAIAQKEPGTGLGLSLSRSFIEKHGGTVSIESELELGTRVTILLPAGRILDDADEMAPALAVN